MDEPTGMPEAERVRRFREEREQLNETVLSYADLTIKRFFSLDTQAYRAGALDEKTKELLGFVASLVLRCDDCILYHTIRCKEVGVSDKELVEACGVGLVVGGSITIPHLRRALRAWDEMKNTNSTQPPEPDHKSHPDTRFELIVSIVSDLVAGPEARDEKLLRICRLLTGAVGYYNWVGFYLVEPEQPEELVLGPYVGAVTDHTRIPFGRGICGQAAARKATFLVQDVSKETNYLSCSVDVKSEIVVPIMAGGRVLGELDIDSHALAPFSDADRRALEKICELVATLW